jgi:hypothetical protein
MSSKKKIAANRANAQKSTGPKTQAGKDVSRRNSLVHGLTAEALLLDHEDPAAFQDLRDALHAAYPPTDALDRETVDRLVMTVWRMRRIPAYERSILAWMMHRQHVEHDGPSGEMPTPASAKGVTAIVPNGLSLAKGSPGDADLQHLRTGRALEALLERNALGKLDAHQARLSRELEDLLEWLELQKRGRVGFPGGRAVSSTRVVDAEPEVIPPRIARPSVQGESAPAASANAPPTSIDWQAASARGGYISPTEREARKQEAQLKGGSANTAG